MNPIPTRIPGFELTPATPDDVPLVLEFIRELARYEKLLHEVEATEDDIRDGLFGPHPTVEVVLGREHGEPVAFALYFRNFSTFTGRPGIYLEDLFVKESHRGRGYGAVLLAYLAKLARDRGCRRFEWSVLDWNTPAVEFYRSIGARPLEDFTVQRVAGAALDALADRF